LAEQAAPREGGCAGAGEKEKVTTHWTNDTRIWALHLT
jgi:hypothetical protein